MQLMNGVSSICDQYVLSALHRQLPPEPEYTVLREPLEGEPEFLVMEVKLPKVVSACMDGRQWMTRRMLFLLYL